MDQHVYVPAELHGSGPDLSPGDEFYDAGRVRADELLGVAADQCKMVIKLRTVLVVRSHESAQSSLQYRSKWRTKILGKGPWS